MYMKQHILAALSEEFNHWEELLAGMSEAQITAPQLPSNWSPRTTSPICGPGSSVPSHGWRLRGLIGNPHFQHGRKTVKTQRRKAWIKSMPTV